MAEVDALALEFHDPLDVGDRINLAIEGPAEVATRARGDKAKGGVAGEAVAVVVEEAVDDFVVGAVATDSDHRGGAGAHGVLRESGRVAGALGEADIDDVAVGGKQVGRLSSVALEAPQGGAGSRARVDDEDETGLRHRRRCRWPRPRLQTPTSTRPRCLRHSTREQRMRYTRPRMSHPLKPRFDAIRRELEAKFLAKEEIIRLMLIATIAGEHMVLIGPPGTAKSAVIRSFAKLIDAKYFEYLLTRFSEPNELFGPVDIQGFRQGTYRRVTTGMLPEAEIVFLDEAFKANSAILNSLLTLLNERRFNNGAVVTRVPLISLFAASNEVPSSDNLDAIFDRFLLRVHSDNLDSYHFHELMTKGLALERASQREDLAESTRASAPAQIAGIAAPPPLPSSSSSASGPVTTMKAILTAADLHTCRRALLDRVEFPEEFMATYKGLCFQLRGEGVSLSDRRVVRLLKLFAASAFLDGRSRVHEGDLFILRHTWNNLDQRELLDDVVEPIIAQYYAAHPDDRPNQIAADLDRLVSELNLVDRTLTQGGELSDIQLFTQLRNLNDLRAAFAAHGGDTAQRMVKKIDTLLEQVFEGGRFSAENAPQR